MIMKAENIDVNSKKMKRDYTVKKIFLQIKKKKYRDCIKRKWRQDWDMNETL